MLLSSQFQANENIVQQELSTSNQFDFIINSIWTNIVAGLDFNLNVIFSPSDPDLFHRRYLESFEFLNKFELKCSQFEKDIKSRIKKSNSYKYFIKKWPTQVYFQIRFQEIVLKFEEDLINYHELIDSETDDDLDQNNFNLKISDTLIKQMEYCWIESKCFLKSLLSNFWKLNLQLVSRYSYYFIQIFQNKISSLEVDYSEANSKEQIEQEPTFQIANDESEQGNNTITDIKLAVFLLYDAHKLQTSKVKFKLFLFKIKNFILNL